MRLNSNLIAGLKVGIRLSEPSSKAAIARALRNWALASAKFAEAEIPQAHSIENALRQKLTAAYLKI